MKFSRLIAATLLAAASVPAVVSAQAEAPKVEVTVGTMVFGPQGAEVGKVTEVGDGYVVVDTGANLATLPSDAFGRNPQEQVIISMTKTQLDEAIAKATQEAEAKLAAALVPGAAVSTADGVQVGTVGSVNADGSVVLAHNTAGDIALPRNQFTTDASGAAALVFTAEQLNAALAPNQEAAAALDAALVSGAAVATSDGIAVGTVKNINADGTVVVERSSGPIAFPKDQFTVNSEGALALRFTDAQLKAALGGA